MTTLTRLLATALTALASISLPACSSSDDGTPGAATSSFQLRELTLAPTTIPVGETSTLKGTVSFDGKAAEGDAQFDLEVTLPGGTKQALPRSPVQGTAGVKSGSASVAVLLGPPAAGTYVVTLTMIDATGAKSNAASVDVVAK